MPVVACALALGVVLAQRPAGRRRAAVDRHRRLGRRLPGLRRRRGRDALAPTGTTRPPRRPRRPSTTSSWSPTATPTSRSASPTPRSTPSRARTSFDEPLPLRALGTLYSNFTHVVALKDSGSRRIEDLRGQDGLDRRAELRHRGDRAAADGGRRPRSRQGRDAPRDGRGGVQPRRCARARSTRSCGPAACPRARSPTSRRPTRSCCCRSTPTCRAQRALRRGLRGVRGRGGRVPGRRRRSRRSPSRTC